MTDGESSRLPEYLLEGGSDAEPSLRREPSPRPRLSTAAIAARAVASAAIGSAVTLRFTKATSHEQTFTPDMIEARSLNYMGWDGALVSALGGEVWEPPPHATLSAEFVFSEPAPARIFTLIVRREIVAQKQRGDSVEIDLNCC